VIADIESGYELPAALPGFRGAIVSDISSSFSDGLNC